MLRPNLNKMKRKQNGEVHILYMTTPIPSGKVNKVLKMIVIQNVYAKSNVGKHGLLTKEMVGSGAIKE
jgi:hypothetical protein